MLQPFWALLNTLLFFLLLFSFSGQIVAATLPLSPEVKDFNPAKYVSFIEDPQHKLTIDDLLDATNNGLAWTTNGDKTINFGYTNSVFWFKLEFKNTSDQPLHRLIEVSYPMLNEATAYYYRGDTHLSTLEIGNAKPFSNRPVKHRHLIYPLELPPHANRTVYFKVSGTYAVQFPVRIWSETEFWQHDQLQILINCMYFGLTLVMIFYHMFIAWSTRDPIYYRYIAFLVFVGGYAPCYRGFAHQYLWPDFTYWNSMSHIVLTPICNIVTILFSIELLRLKETLPSFYKMLMVFATGSTLCIPCFFFFDITTVTVIATLIIVLTANVLLVAGFLCWNKGRVEARIFTVAYSIFLSGSSLLAFNKFGWLPFNQVTEFSLQIGSAVETVLLSLALAFRIKRMRKDSDGLVKARLNAQEKRIRAIQELKEGVAKTQFLAMMSHEIRTPLNGVLGLVEILKESPLSKKQQTLVRTIQSSGEMLLSITNDILDFSKTDSGSIHIERKPVMLRQMVDECGLIYSIKAMNSGFPLFTYIAPEVPEVIHTDGTKLKQVLSNLLGNAFKFTEQGFVLLCVSALTKNGKTFIRIEVMDTGIGISKSEQIRLFELFSQANQSTTRQYGGTGLGLAICKKIVLAMGSEVGLDSDTGKGAHFWFEMPTEAQPISHQAKSLAICLITDNQHFIKLFNTINKHNCFELHSVLVGDPTTIELPSINPDKVFVCFDENNPSRGSVLSLVEDTFKMSKGIYSIENHLDASLEPTNAPIVKLHSPIELHHLLAEHESRNRVGEKVRNHDDLPETVKQLRVLVAEDNLVNQMVVKGLIKPFVGKLNLVKNGLEAVEFFKQHHQQLDLIFMDCDMPVMDGYEATKTIRELEKAMAVSTPIKIVALTAHAFEQFREKTFASGMDEHLTKPINSTILKRFFLEHYPLSLNEQENMALPPFSKSEAGSR